MDKLIVGLMAFIGLFAVIVLFAFISAFVTQYTWDNSVAQIFHLQSLTFWQAFCLNVLGGMVCKSSSIGKSK